MLLSFGGSLGKDKLVGSGSGHYVRQGKTRTHVEHVHLTLNSILALIVVSAVHQRSSLVFSLPHPNCFPPPPLCFPALLTSTVLPDKTLHNSPLRPPFSTSQSEAPNLGWQSPHGCLLHSELSTWAHCSLWPELLLITQTNSTYEYFLHFIYLFILKQLCYHLFYFSAVL